jgi:DNA polymerase-3 subunit delta'
MTIRQTSDPPRGWTTFGHPGPSKLLRNTARAGRLAHAYLITGPDQSGRRTLALDVARAVNCTPAPDLFGVAKDRPCGECPQCVRITRGLHADVRVINADTQTEEGRRPADGGEARHKQVRIEHVRDIERQASLKPFEGRSRVFVIDGVETLSQEAANAILKTLEEPPPDVLIILVALSASTLPQTVVSRCQLVELRPVAAEVIERALLERFNAAPEQARTLARLARGRPGWAVAALQDPATLDRQTQAAQRILAALTGGLEARFRYARELGESFWRRRDDVLTEMDMWLDWWRDVALARNGLERFVTNVDWLPALTAVGLTLNDAAISTGAETVARTKRSLEANAIPRLALEVMMLDLPHVDSAQVQATATASAGQTGGRQSK